MHTFLRRLGLTLLILLAACSGEPESQHTSAPATESTSETTPPPPSAPETATEPAGETTAHAPVAAPTTTEVTVKSEVDDDKGSFGSLFSRAIGGWEVFFFLLLFGLTAFLAFTFMKAFNGFVERVRKGRGAWRAFVLSIAPIVRIGVLLGLLLVFGFILFEGSGAVLVILLAIVAISVGLGLVELVRNILAGALIGLQKPFAIGDLVSIGQLSGRVQYIGLRSTLLIGTDGRRIDVPNSHFQTDVVVNTSLTDIGTPVEMRVALPTDTDIRAAKTFAFRAAYISQYASPRRSPEVLVEQESERELALVITAYTFAPEFAGRLKSEIIELLFEGLKSKKTSTSLISSI